MVSPPPHAVWAYWEEKQIIFDYLSVSLEGGSDGPSKPFRLLPRIAIVDDTTAVMFFVFPFVRTGRIRLGPHACDALLAQAETVRGRFDHPRTELLLTPLSERDVLGPWHGLDELGAFREVADRLYVISASRSGDQVTVRPYRGAFGILRIGRGGRDVEEMAIGGGELRSKTTLVPLGNPIMRASAQERTEWRVPEGIDLDGGYQDFLVTVTYETMDCYGTVRGVRTFRVRPAPRRAPKAHSRKGG